MEEKSKSYLNISFRRATSQDERGVLALGTYYQGMDSISYEFGKLIINPSAICTVCLSGDKIVAFDCAFVSKCQTFVSYCHARTDEKLRNLSIFGSLRRFTLLNVKMQYQNIAEVGFITQSIDIWEPLIKSKKKPGYIQGYSQINAVCIEYLDRIRMKMNSGKFHDYLNNRVIGKHDCKRIYKVDDFPTEIQEFDPKIKKILFPFNIIQYHMEPLPINKNTLETLLERGNCCFLISKDKQLSFSVGTIFILDDKIRYDFEYYGSDCIDNPFVHLYHHLLFLISYEKILPRKPAYVTIFHQRAFDKYECREFSLKFDLINFDCAVDQISVIDKIPDCVIVKMAFADHFKAVDKAAKFKPTENEILKSNL